MRRSVSNVFVLMGFAELIICFPFRADAQSIRSSAANSPTVVAQPASQLDAGIPALSDGRILTYTFDPIVTKQETVLHVTLMFQGGPEGAEDVEIPTEYGGEKLHSLTSFRAVSEGTTIDRTGQTHDAGVRYTPNSQVVLTYDLKKDWSGPFKNPLQFHPVLTAEYLEINGDNALVHPRLDGKSPVTVDFEWKQLPATWALATSFGLGFGSREQRQTYTGPWKGVRDALFTAGEFRIHRFTIRNQPAVLAIRGEWTFTDDEAIAEIQKAIGAVRDFWHDYDFPYFLVTVKPYDQDHGSSDGSEFTNAFWMYMSRLDPLSPALLAQMAHEAFHEWNPWRMGTFPLEDWKRTEWFREGFTQYYSYLLVYRAGFLPLPAYLNEINFDLHNYMSRPNPDIRGPVIALWLDGQIRKRSKNRKSLDDVMRDMVRGRDKPLTEARILRTAGKYLSAKLRRQLERIVANSGEALTADAIPVPKVAAIGRCARVTIDHIPEFDAGLDVARSVETRLVTGVEKDGPAFEAGLRNGQQLVGLSIYKGQPDKLAVLRIKSDSGVRRIEYYPHGTTDPIPQIHLNKSVYESSPQSCRNW